MGGLWEPITVEHRAAEDPCKALMSGFAARCGIQPLRAQRLGELTHIFTHRRLSLSVYELFAPEMANPVLGTGYEALTFLDPDAPTERPLSKLARKTLRLAISDQAPALVAEPPPRS